MMKSEIKHDGLRTWLEVDRAKVKHNYRIFRGLLRPETRLMAVVKSNAYGHDLFQFSKLQEELGADWLGVDSVVEGGALREAGIKIPILVLGYTLPEKFAAAAVNNLSLTISTFENLALLAKTPVKFHLKIDTGMHRQGFLPEQIPEVLSKLKALSSKPKAIFEGLYTHLAAAKNPAFPRDTREQLAQFNEATALVRNAGFTPLTHAAATSGAIVFPESHLDLVRIGIGLYGLWPSPEVAAGFGERLDLQPVLAWRTIISEIKTLPARARIGYDFTETLPSSGGRVAICPVGYWHGIPRSLSSIGHLLVHDERCKILGRVSMDMIIVDVTKIKNPKVGDVVTLIGRGGEKEITTDELANLSGTVNYEMITRLNPLIKRIYLN